MHGRVLFADDMGMGKTLQALAVADYYRRTSFASSSSSSNATLILCPATLRLTWAKALTRWLPSVSRLSVHIVTSPAHFESLLRLEKNTPRDPWDSVPPVSFVVCSYDLLPRLNTLGDKSFPIVLADECHLLRNYNTARTRAAIPLLLCAAVRVLISGTPALSRPMDLYPLLYTLLNTKEAPFLSYDHFLQRYCNGSMPTPAPISHAHELNSILSAVMIRRSKTDVKIALPAKRRVHVMVNLSGDRLQPLKEMQEQAKQIQDQLNELHDPNTTEPLRMQREAIYSILYTRTADVKIRATLTRIFQLVCKRQSGRGPKTLVFAHHVHVLEAVEIFLQNHRVGFVRIDGSTNCEQRESAVNDFQNDCNIRVGILSLNVASTGVTLTAADVVLFAELCWTPATLAQAEDRAHRLGRVGEVRVEYIIAPGTIDDAMMTTLGRKVGVLNKAVEGEVMIKASIRDATDTVIKCSEEIVLSDIDIDTVVSDSIEIGRGINAGDCGDGEEGLDSAMTA